MNVRYSINGPGEPDVLIARSEIRAAVKCPECGAERGANCIGVRGKLRESNHALRVILAKRAKRLAGQI